MQEELLLRAPRISRLILPLPIDELNPPLSFDYDEEDFNGSFFESISYDSNSFENEIRLNRSDFHYENYDENLLILNSLNSMISNPRVIRPNREFTR